MRKQSLGLAFCLITAILLTDCAPKRTLVAAAPAARVGTLATIGDSEVNIHVRPSVALLPCVRFYSIGQVNKVGMRNGCGECKIAVVNFVYPNGSQPPKSEIKRFR